LSSPLEAPASARKFAQIHRIVDCDEDRRPSESPCLSPASP
jgi:hypothetical protein